MAKKKPAAVLTLRDAPVLAATLKKAKAPYTPFAMSLAQLEPQTRIPTGIGPIDLYTMGGFPEGGTTLLTGKSGSGKTTVATLALAGYQKLRPDMKALYLNVENKIDPVWARKLGVNLDIPEGITLYRPESTEEGQYIVRHAMEEREDVGFILVDSLAALCPEGEGEAEVGEEQMGLAARLNNKWFRQVVSLQNQLVAKHKSCTLVIINQERESMKLYGGTVLPGGNGQRFQAALWIRFLKAEHTLHPKLDIPMKTLIRFVLEKNMGGASGWPGEFYLHVTPHGPWKVGDIEDHGFVWQWAAQRLGIVRAAGSKGFEFDGTFGKKEDFLTQWRAQGPLYSLVKQLLGKQFQAWLDSTSTLSEETNAGEVPQVETMAVLGEVLGGATPGKTSTGLG